MPRSHGGPKRSRFLLPLLLLLSVSCNGSDADVRPPESDQATKWPVHESPIAGTWYPGRPETLRTMLQAFFDAVPDPLPDIDERNAIAAIAPHAGYRYSGPTAAYAVAALARRPSPPDRIVILGPSHRVFPGISVGEFSAYATPLGRAPLDTKTIERLRRCKLARNVPEADTLEHSVDIEVPLLQYAFGERLPPLVPVVVGSLGESDYAILAKALAEVVTPRTAILVSSDFTHYGRPHGYVPFPNDDETESSLRDLLQRSAAAISTCRRQEFAKYLDETGDTICGQVPIQVLLEMLPNDARATVLHSDLSGAQTGGFSNSVSYLSMAFSSEAGWPEPPAASSEAVEQTGATDNDAPTTLTSQERSALLSLARRTVEAAVRGESLPDIDASLKTPALAEERAAFVTLTEGGELRGCIGSILPHEPLAESVRSNAVNAALRDPRFPRVRPDELPEIHIEISALTVPREVASYDRIQLGRDGIILSKGFARAVFLPQVAPEQGWDIDETLTHLSMKAGLSPTAWKDAKTRFEVFQAEVFEVPEPHPAPEP
ncbi:AmmeMemoRadiSam system protein A [Candidatus Sumerlaeota bacterium]|nr:AmmeMemoRadiSam system protein A [Candidatus Sumerlaeota bacterium]